MNVYADTHMIGIQGLTLIKIALHVWTVDSQLYWPQLATRILPSQVWKNKHIGTSCGRKVMRMATLLPPTSHGS